MENKDIGPLVSVVIPYYNDGLYIEETVNSMLNQTYTNIEIIIINDGSTDEFSIEKLANFDNPKIRIINQQNAGGAAARNTGFQNSSSQYVLTLDGDDMFEENFLEKAITVLEKNTNIAAVSSWVKGFGESEFVWKAEGGTIKNFVNDNQSVACALIRKSVWQEVDGYSEEFRNAYEDWDFWLRVTNLGYEVYTLQEPLFLYRQKKSSTRLDTENNHLESYKNLILKNKDIFSSFVVEVLLDKESKSEKGVNQLICSKDKKIEELSNSKEYKIGRAILYPFCLLAKIFR